MQGPEFCDKAQNVSKIGQEGGTRRKEGAASQRDGAGRGSSMAMYGMRQGRG